MDKFVEFNYLVVDASPAARGGTPREPFPCRVRVDVIARQFRDLLRQGPLSDDRPRGMVLTDDFKVSGRVTPAAGWLTFHVDRGDGSGRDLEQVAVVAFGREPDEAVIGLMRRVAPALAGRPLPPAPFAVAVLLVGDLPSIVSDFLTKVAAGFFDDEL